MITWLLLLLFHMTESEYIYSNKPLPKADLLDEVLSNVVNRTDYTGSLFSYLTGNEDFGDPDNLDVCVLDANNVFKIISKAKKQYEPWFRRTKSEALSRNPKIVEQAMDLMRQSIYATRYRMQETKKFRKFFTDDPSFHIAVFYGALMQVIHKMEALYTIMRKMHQHTHLIWYLILYEKLLAAHVDTHNFVDRMFDLHEKAVKIFREGKQVDLVPRLSKSTTGTRTRGVRATAQRFSTKATIRFDDFRMNVTGDDPSASSTDKAATEPNYADMAEP